jgi:hypothetical protein
MEMSVPIGMTDDDLCGQHTISEFFAENDDRVPYLCGLGTDTLSDADGYRVGPSVQ